jgi:hypothetical protein
VHSLDQGDNVATKTNNKTKTKNKNQTANRQATAFGMDIDQLSESELAKEYGLVLRIIQITPELNSLFKKALNDPKGRWLPRKFTAALQESRWYAENASWAREALARQAMGGADWDEEMREAKETIRQQAQKVGIPLGEAEIDQYASRYLMEGWSRPERQRFMQQELAKHVGRFTGEDGGPAGFRGGTRNFIDSLRNTAMNNGLDLNEGYFLSASKSVLAGLTTEDDWANEIREQAASLFPIFGDKIRAGADVKDLASGYINMMAEEFEILPEKINLKDPYVTQALGGLNPDGNPQAMSLWDFRTMLRKDPRWQQTNKAQNEIASIAESVLRTFGMVG